MTNINEYLDAFALGAAPLAVEPPPVFDGPTAYGCTLWSGTVPAIPGLKLIVVKGERSDKPRVGIYVTSGLCLDVCLDHIDITADPAVLAPAIIAAVVESGAIARDSLSVTILAAARLRARLALPTPGISPDFTGVTP